MPQPAPTISLTDTIAAIAAAISFIALFVGLYAASVSRQVASSGFQAVEKVKLETATFIAVLRSLMVKELYIRNRISTGVTIRRSKLTWT